MSEENVEAFERAIEAYNRRDIDGVLGRNGSRRGVGGHFALVEGEAKVYRGHEGVRQWLRDIDETFADIRLEIPEVRDRGTELSRSVESAPVAAQAEPRSRRPSVVWSSGTAVKAPRS